MEVGLKGLSRRLRAIAEAVLAGRPAADIGTDHALLPAHLVRSGRVPRVIASDVARGPLERARRTLLELGVQNVELRAGDGLDVLRRGEVATCVLAGTGGPLIRKLLDDAPTLTPSFERLVLQPNTDWVGMRAWIAAHGWTLVDEAIASERRHHYLVLSVDPRTRTTVRWSREDLELGPILRRRPNERWRAWLRDRLRRHHRALAQARSVLPDSDPRVEHIAQTIDWLRTHAHA